VSGVACEEVGCEMINELVECNYLESGMEMRDRCSPRKPCPVIVATIFGNIDIFCLSSLVRLLPPSHLTMFRWVYPSNTTRQYTFWHRNLVFKF
jgi:hypothetical protein